MMVVVIRMVGVEGARCGPCYCRSRWGKGDGVGDEIVQDEDEVVQEWMLLPKGKQYGRMVLLEGEQS